VNFGGSLKAVAGGRAGNLRMGGEHVKKSRRRPAVGAHRAPVVVKADVQRQRKRTGLITWPGLCSGRAGCVIAAGLVRSNANAICYIEVMAR
jgi:hypothetical protein